MVIPLTGAPKVLLPSRYRFVIIYLFPVAVVLLCNSWDYKVTKKSRDGSVGIVLGYGLDDRGSRVRFSAGAGNFSLHHSVQNGSGSHPASYPMGTRGSFSAGKAAGAWSWPLTSSSAEVNAWSYTSTPQYALMAWCLVKHRDNLTFTFYKVTKSPCFNYLNVATDRLQRFLWSDVKFSARSPPPRTQSPPYLLHSSPDSDELFFSRQICTIYVCVCVCVCGLFTSFHHLISTVWHGVNELNSRRPIRALWPNISLFNAGMS
jgi:hypothetical protein